MDKPDDNVFLEDDFIDAFFDPELEESFIPEVEAVSSTQRSNKERNSHPTTIELIPAEPKPMKRLNPYISEGRRAKRIFHGPAGIIPDIKMDGVNFKDEDDLQCDDDKDKMLIESSQDIAYFSKNPWLEMRKMYSYVSWDQFNINMVKKNAKVIYKVPFLAAVIISLSKELETVILKDETGEIQGWIDCDIFKEYSNDFVEGSVVVIKEFCIVSPPKVNNCYVILTPSNLVAIFRNNESPRSSQFTQEENMFSKVKITKIGDVSIDLLKEYVNINRVGAQKREGVKHEKHQTNFSGNKPNMNIVKRYSSNSRAEGSTMMDSDGSKKTKIVPDARRQVLNEAKGNAESTIVNSELGKHTILPDNNKFKFSLKKPVINKLPKDNVNSNIFATPCDFDIDSILNDEILDFDINPKLSQKSDLSKGDDKEKHINKSRFDYKHMNSNDNCSTVIENIDMEISPEKLIPAINLNLNQKSNLSKGYDKDNNKSRFDYKQMISNNKLSMVKENIDIENLLETRIHDLNLNLSQKNNLGKADDNEKRINESRFDYKQNTSNNNYSIAEENIDVENSTEQRNRAINLNISQENNLSEVHNKEKDSMVKENIDMENKSEKQNRIQKVRSRLEKFQFLANNKKEL